MHFLIKNYKFLQCLPYKPQQIGVYQQNIKNFSSLLKSTNSSTQKISPLFNSKTTTTKAFGKFP